MTFGGKKQRSMASSKLKGEGSNSSPVISRRKKKEPTARERALEFAKNVPKPKPKLSKEVPQQSYSPEK